MLKKITRIVTNHPVITISITLIMTIVFFYGLTRVKIVTDTREMLLRGNPVAVAFDEANETFGGMEFVIVAIESDNIFTYDVLNEVYELTNDLEKIKGVRSVTSIVNIEEIRGIEHGIEVRGLIEDIPSSKEKLNQLRNRILSDKDYAGNIVSEDGKVTTIMVQLGTQINRPEVVYNIKEVVKGINLTTHLIGSPVLESYITDNVMKDLIRLIPIAILVVIAILFFIFKNLQGVIVPLLVVIISTIWAVGLMGFCGIYFSNISSILPIILISVGTAYVIHIIAHYQEESISESSKTSALNKTISIMGLPVILAGITTMVGFAANIFSPVRPIKEMGMFTAFGVGVALLLSISLVPAVLSMLRVSKPRVQKKDGLLRSLLDKISTLTTRRPKTVLIGAGIIGLLALIFIPRLNIEFDLMSFFKSGSSPYIALNLINDKFGGADLIQLVVKGDIQEPDVLKHIEQLQEEIEKIEILGESYSIVNVLKDVNKALHEGNPDYKILPSSREEVVQYLLLLSLGGAEGLDRILSFGYDQAVIQTMVAISSSSEREAMIASINESSAKIFEDVDAEVIVTGVPVLGREIVELLVKGQFQSLAVAILFVLILMIVVTRSFVYGIFCIIPITLTILLNFIVMYWTNVPLDMVTAMIASIGIGVGIDYSIHFFNRYKVEKGNGKTPEEAIRFATITTGQAIFYNAIVVGIGFSVLIFSQVPPLGTFGWLIGLIMLFSSCGALTVLPSLLVLRDRVVSKGG